MFVENVFNLGRFKELCLVCFEGGELKGRRGSEVC